MVTTVAPTMPVDAASNMPTMETEMPRPPRRVPNNRPMFSNSSSATLERSNITPMKTKSGTAMSTSLVMVPKMRCGMAPKKVCGSKIPNAQPSRPKNSPTPAREKATGNPMIRTTQATANMMRSRYSTMV